MNYYKRTRPPYNNEKFSWGHLFLIAVFVYLAYVAARHCKIIRDGKQPVIHLTDIKPEFK